MVQLIADKEPVARKAHRCAASDFLRDVLHDTHIAFTEQEQADIKQAEANSWRIQVGEKYTHQVCVRDGHIYTFKAITAIHKICIKYELYPED